MVYLANTICHGQSEVSIHKFSVTQAYHILNGSFPKFPDDTSS